MSATIVVDPGTGSTVGSTDEAEVGTEVTFTNQDNTGVQGWLWELVDIPEDSVVTVAEPNSASGDFTPDVEGTYLLRLTTYTDAERTNVDAVDQIGIGVRLGAPLNVNWRIPAAGERTEFHSTKGWKAEVNPLLKETARFLDIGHFDTPKTGTYTVGFGESVRVSTGPGAATINLPAVGSANKGQRVRIVHVAGSAAATISANGSNTIEGEASVQLSGLASRVGETIVLESSGSNSWKILQRYYPQIVGDVTGAPHAVSVVALRGAGLAASAGSPPENTVLRRAAGGGWEAGQVDTDYLADGSVTSEKLAEGAVGIEDLDGGAENAVLQGTGDGWEERLYLALGDNASEEGAIRLAEGVLVSARLVDGESEIDFDVLKMDGGDIILGGKTFNFGEGDIPTVGIVLDVEGRVFVPVFPVRFEDHLEIGFDNSGAMTPPAAGRLRIFSDTGEKVFTLRLGSTDIDILQNVDGDYVFGDAALEGAAFILAGDTVKLDGTSLVNITSGAEVEVVGTVFAVNTSSSISLSTGLLSASISSFDIEADENSTLATGGSLLVEASTSLQFDTEGHVDFNLALAANEYRVGINEQSRLRITDDVVQVGSEGAGWAFVISATGVAIRQTGDPAGGETNYEKIWSGGPGMLAHMGDDDVIHIL